MRLLCQSTSAVLQTSDVTAAAVGVRCKQWDCDYCGPINRRTLLKRLKDVRVSSFLTLTCNPAYYPSPSVAIRKMSIAVNYLIKRLRRRFPSDYIAYLLVWEQTKSGWPHAHLLIDAPYIPQRLISLAWTALTGAPIVDIRGVRNRSDIANYVSKYLTKAPSAPAGMKRWRCSRGFLEPPALPTLAPWQEGDHWHKTNQPLSSLTDALVGTGWTPEIINPNLLILTLTGAPDAPPYWQRLRAMEIASHEVA